MTRTSRRFRRRPWRKWLVPVLLTALVSARIAYDRWRPGATSPADGVLAEGEYQLVRVVDGDTLIVRTAGTARNEPDEPGPYRIRLLGIDCPESVRPNWPVERWGPEASQFTRDFVAGGRVRLRFDKRRRDRYRRYLAYVFVADKLLNEELVRGGLARVYAFPGDSVSMTRRLKLAEDEARAQRRGIWSSP